MDYIKDNETFTDVYTKYYLDQSKYIHKKYPNSSDTGKVFYYICEKDKLHTIIFNDESIEIPINMNIHEFQIYIRSIIDICRINEDSSIYKYKTFSGELFVTNNNNKCKYTNKL